MEGEGEPGNEKKPTRSQLGATEGRADEGFSKLKVNRERAKHLKTKIASLVRHEDSVICLDRKPVQRITTPYQKKSGCRYKPCHIGVAGAESRHEQVIEGSNFLTCERMDRSHCAEIRRQVNDQCGNLQ